MSSLHNCTPRSGHPLLLMVALWPIAFAGSAAAQAPTQMAARAGRLADATSAPLIVVRHDLHRHPEVSGEEVRTSGIVAERLRELGYAVRTDVGGHGVVGVLHGSKPGPVVAYRADMDAVRSTAHDPVPYRSLTPGVRHICGHDVHVVVGLGIAEVFAGLQSELAGTILMIFQPAEEIATGARAMLADGAFAPRRPDAIFALHTSPYEVGTLGTMAGGMMAGRSRVRVTITGQGDHDGMLRHLRERIAAVGTLSPEQAFQTPPRDFILAQVFRAGRESSTRSVLQAQMSTASAAARIRARRGVESVVAALAGRGLTLQLEYDDLAIAGVTNDSRLVAAANASIARTLGDGALRIVDGVPPVFSEDFGSFQQQAPGVMYFLGVSNAKQGTTGMPHSDDYVADDAAIAVGVKALAIAMLDRLYAAAP